MTRAASKRGSSRPPAPNRRGSPDVVEKRRAARHFNDVLLGRAARALDGRTEKRRRRLLQELAEGAARGGKRELKPIDVLSRVQALLDLGEPLASIKRACPPRKVIEPTAEVVDGLRRLHRAYGFAFEAYRFVGLDDAALKRAGIRETSDPRPRPSGSGAPGLARTSSVATGAAPAGRARRGAA